MVVYAQELLEEYKTLIIEEIQRPKFLQVNSKSFLHKEVEEIADFEFENTERNY